MSSTKLLTLLLFVFAPLLSTTVWAHGGESSAGGADDYQVVSAFFRSYDAAQTVTACLEIAPGFEVDAPTLTTMVQSAFKQWSDYIGIKRLNMTPGHDWIQTRLALNPVCTGSENLRFLFGVQSPEVNQYKSQFSKPFGFAQLIDDGSDGIHPVRAMVWIAPNGGVDSNAHIPSWAPEHQKVLAALILHEVGHVFGCGHVDGTVMTEKIGQYLENDSALPPYRNDLEGHLASYSTIDSQVELVPCLECDAHYAGEVTYDPIHVPGTPALSDWAIHFKTLAGREPVGAVNFSFERTGNPMGSGLLTVTDTLGSTGFPVLALTQIGEHSGTTPLFAGNGGTNYFSFGVSFYSMLKTFDGSSVPVALNYNMDGKKVEIVPLGSGFYPRPIFVSAP